MMRSSATDELTDGFRSVRVASGADGRRCLVRWAQGGVKPSETPVVSLILGFHDVKPKKMMLILL